MLHSHFKRLVKEENGNVIILVGIMAFLLILSVGVAIDMARAEILQQRISAALDAAGLAAMESIGTAPVGYTNAQWVQAQAQRYFNANFPTGYLGSTTITPTTSLDDPADDTLTLTATTSQSTTFMQTFGVSTMSVSANSQVTRSSNGTVVELVLVLDNTGSMACDVSNPNTSGLGCTITPTSKITALQSAATSLVNKLLTSGATTIYIGIVPFSQAVNVGTVQNPSGSWMDPSDPNISTNTGSWPVSVSTQGVWQGCVTARYPLNKTDDTPSAQPFDTYWYAPPEVTNNDYFSLTGGTTDADWINIWRTSAGQSPSPLTDGPYTAPAPYTYHFGTVPVYGIPNGPNLFCPQVVTPLTANKDNLNAAIAAMTPSGDTLLDQGMVWGLRMISPKWRGLWNSSDMINNSLPNDFGAPGVAKYVVLITDGSDHLAQGGYSAYGFVSQGELGPSFTDDPATPAELLSAEQQIDTNFLNVCNTLGTNGVTIYTVGFGPQSPDNPLTQTDRNDGYLDGNLLAQCASYSPNSTGYYYAAPSNADLDAAFNNIINSIENVRVSK